MAGITQKKCAAYRAKLVKELALTEFVRSWAEDGRREFVAEWLGVRPELLDEAAIALRTNFGGSKWRMKRRPRREVRVFLPKILAHPFIAIAHKMAMTHLQLLRSLMHAAMLTPYEPNPRPGKVWLPLPGCEAFRGELVEFHRREKLRDGPSDTTRYTKRQNCKLQSAPGLAEAIEKRATAFGVRPMRYIMLWVADLVDGQLSHLVIPGVESAQTFDEPSAYVLPVLTVLEQPVVGSTP